MSDTETLNWPRLFHPGDQAAPVLLMLHGTGGNETEIAELAPRLDAFAGVLAPRGRVSEYGVRRWFNRHSEGVFDVDDVIQRGSDFAAFISAAKKVHTLGQRPIIAVGFSNGANMALATALLHPEVLTGVIAFSGMYPLGERQSDADLSATKVLLLNGDKDAMAPLHSVSILVEELHRGGASVEQVLRPGGHGILETDLAIARTWLKQHWKQSL